MGPLPGSGQSGGAAGADRRNYEFQLTDAGQRVLGKLRGIAEQHEAELLAPLSDDQVAQLDRLLAQLADGHGLARGLRQAPPRGEPLSATVLRRDV